MQLLIEYGAEIDPRDNSQYTPLMVAALRGSTFVLKVSLYII